VNIETNTILGPAHHFIQSASYNSSSVFLVNSYGSCDHSTTVTELVMPHLIVALSIFLFSFIRVTDTIDETPTFNAGKQEYNLHSIPVPSVGIGKDVRLEA